MTRKLRISSLPLIAATLTLALVHPGCGKKEEEGSVGTDCDPDADAPCNDGLSCTESDSKKGGTCTYLAGEPCDSDAEDLDRGGCGPDAECVSPARTESAADSLSAGGAVGEGAEVCLLTEGALCDPEEPHCGNDLVCAENTLGENRCYGRVVLRGGVSDTTDASAIAGAHVIGLDEEGYAVTDVSVSAEDGSYLLDIPVLREEDGTPADKNFTLNASAQDYQPFPSGVRVALPISAGTATREGTLYVVESALTDVGLIPLPDGERFIASGSVSGLSEESNVAGLLVVATGLAGTFTAITDLNGVYTIFNLPAGDYEVRAYGAGVQVGAESISVADENLSEVVLTETAEGTTTVSGNINIVNAPGGSLTSVILVVEDTFNETAARGEVPRGLRAPASGPVSVTGAFTIENVPAGKYVVLAAFENDNLVRDPDSNIAGTSIVHIEVTAGEETLELSDLFKITEALTILSPGAEGPEEVSSKPVLEWADDSSEDWYDLYVYDAFGEEVWNSLMIPGVSGSESVSVTYAGPMEPGMYYQFRVTSWRQAGGGDPSAISATEDLRGVFFTPAP